MRFFLLIFFCVTLYAQISYEDAYSEYKAKNYEKALKDFKHLVKEDQDYDAAYILGYMYEHGEGCEVDTKKAMQYYKMASRGFYFQRKADPSRDAKKEQKKMVTVVDDVNDSETYDTLKQYAQSLYNIKAYRANYFLPISYRYGGREYDPIGDHEMKQAEMEFQVSIRYDYATNVFGYNGIYSFAYTQKSFWQAYATSAYFRESNYNPEFFVMYPIGTEYLKVVRFTLGHESNGRGGTEERAWNYLAATCFFQTGKLFTKVKVWQRLHENIDYNPELIDYMGHGEIEFILPYKKHMLKLMLRSNFSGNSAAEFSYSYPFFGSKDLFFYLKTFNGYGESLIDYNHKIDKVGFGFSISR